MSLDKRTVHINYGQTLLPLEPNGQVLFDLQPAATPPVPDVKQEVQRALNEPVGLAPLRELATPGKRVVVIGDDGTRLTPTDQIIPPLLDELNAGGVPDSDVTLIIATGTHRPMTKDEIASKYGDQVTDRVQVINHDCVDEASLVSCGTTRRGTDIWVNRAVMEADVRIGVGNIVPHHPTGWSAGAKILLPGVAGRRTTAQFHLLGAREQQLGKVDTPCREEMEDFARVTGLDFIVNTVLNSRGQLVRAVAGHFVAAHREGVKWAKSVYGVPFGNKADITLSSTYPIDFDLFQADKGLFSAVLCTKEGGEIILVSPCYEGVSPTHPEAVELGQLDDEALWQLAQADTDHDPLSIAEVLYFNSVKRSFRVTLVSEGIPSAVAQKMGFNHLEPAELLGYLTDRLAAESNLSVGILRHSAEVLPLYKPDVAVLSSRIPTEGLRLWLAADVGITQSDSKVSRWADQSGNGLDALQHTSSRRPALVANGLNGKPVVRFDGEDDFLSFSGIEVNGLTEMTLVLVSSNWKYASNSQWGDEGGPHGTVNAALLFEEVGLFGSWGCVYLSPFQKSVTMRFGTGQVDNCHRWVRPELTDDHYSITLGMKQGSKEQLFVDGEVVATLTSKRTTIASTGDEGWLGRGRVDTFGAFDIAEVLIYDKALSTVELDRLHVYLKGRYFGEEPSGGGRINDLV